MNKGIQDSTIDFIKSEEGEKLQVYKDIAGNDTVGVGHLVLPSDALQFGDTISKDESSRMLASDLKGKAAAIKNLVKVPLNQNQFDALCSLVFNIGEGAFSTSTLLKFINGNKGRQDIINAWMAWNRSKGTIIPALTERRGREVNLFFS